MAHLTLSWPGLHAAVADIAARASWRDRPGVCALDSVGDLLADAIAPRLGLQKLPEATPGALLVVGVATDAVTALLGPVVASGGDLWAWIDASTAQAHQATIHVSPDTLISMPWDPP